MSDFLNYTPFATFIYISCAYLLWFYSRMGRHKRLFITSTDIPIDSEINDQSYELSVTEGDQSAGTNYGEISVWDVGTRERIVYKPFKVWDLSSSSMSFRIMHEVVLIGAHGTRWINTWYN
uniref:Uncharacterized protein n=1 Tax=Lactuca sativa TaxID=4236 RepID=A0A9R1WNN7_LACSA|nr:hypothetical protein LSAT_V11C100005520 [Lactuca sativa]